MNNNLGNRPPLIDAAPIPHELRERDLWLMWGNDDPDAPKRPHWRGNTGVSWPEPNDWRGFNDACTAAEERPAWGIGYIFAYDNDDHPRGLYGVLDLDGCLDANGRPKAWLPSLAPFFDADAYIERSPSGTGLRIPLVGFKPPDEKDVPLMIDHKRKWTPSYH